MSESCYARTPGVIARRIAGETILVPVTRRAQDMGLFTLNEVGTFLWERLDGTRAAADLAAELTGAYDVDAGTARRDVEAFLALLVGAGCAGEVAR